MPANPQLAGVFSALGDPLRLEMVLRLAKETPQTISSVSQGLGVTRQGARKHLQVLADADLVSLDKRGREVLVQLDADTLEQAQRFIAEIEVAWDRRLNALKHFVEGSGNGRGSSG